MAKRKKKVPEVPKEPEYRLYIDYVELREGGEICAGEENSSWPNHEDTHISVHVKGIYRETDGTKMFYDSIVVSEDVWQSDDVVLVTARYSDGDTFSHSTGNFDFIDVFKTYSEAEEFAAKYDVSRWNGYFSSFDGWDIYTYRVEQTLREKSYKRYRY